MAQYVVSSVIQGLLGRQPDMMGSWDMYCSLNLMYLPGVVARGGQGHRPTAATGPSYSGDMAGTCSGSAMTTEPRLCSPPRVMAAWVLRCQQLAAGMLAPLSPQWGPCLWLRQLPVTHPSRQMEDFTLVLAMAFLQYSIWGQPQQRRQVCPAACVPQEPPPPPFPTHLPLVVIHVLGLQEMHRAG